MRSNFLKPNAASRNSVSAILINDECVNRILYADCALREKLVNDLADVDGLNDGSTLLTLAAGRGDTHLMTLLLRHGANPDFRDWKENTALEYAIGSGENKDIYVLIAFGANLDLTNSEGLSPRALLKARTNLPRILRMLIGMDY